MTENFLSYFLDNYEKMTWRCAHADKDICEYTGDLRIDKSKNNLHFELTLKKDSIFVKLKMYEPASAEKNAETSYVYGEITDIKNFPKLKEHLENVQNDSFLKMIKS